MYSVRKADLAEKLYKKIGGIKKDSVKYVEEFFQTIKELSKNGEDVKLHNFGKFSLKSKKARKGRNPSTGETMILEARKVVTFKASNKLKASIKSKLGKE